MSSSVSPAPYGHVPSAPTAAHMPGSPIVAAGSAWPPAVAGNPADVATLPSSPGTQGQWASA